MKIFGIAHNWVSDSEREVRKKATELNIPSREVRCLAANVGSVLRAHWVVRAFIGKSEFDLTSREMCSRDEAAAYARSLEERLQSPPMPPITSRKDVGPLEFYSRLTVGTEGADVRCFNYGLSDPIPGTDRVATLSDTNLPSGRRLMDESISATDLSWHITLPTLPEHLIEVQKLMDRGSWELHVGGEKPFYQGLFCTTALSGMYVMRAYPIALPQDLKLVCGDHCLTESEHFYTRVKPPKLTVPIDVVFRIGCTRCRGVS